MQPKDDVVALILLSPRPRGSCQGDEGVPGVTGDQLALLDVTRCEHTPPCDGAEAADARARKLQPRQSRTQ